MLIIFEFAGGIAAGVKRSEVSYEVCELCLESIPFLVIFYAFLLSFSTKLALRGVFVHIWQINSGFRLGINDSFMHIPTHSAYEDSWTEFQQSVSFHFCKLFLVSRDNMYISYLVQVLWSQQLH